MPGNAFEDDQERPPGPNYAVWIARRGELPALLATWAEKAQGDDQQAFLKGLSEIEVPNSWAVWAVADTVGLNSGGFYMVAPRVPQAIVYMENSAKNVNNVRHIAINPEEFGLGVESAIAGWFESLRPKKVIINRPQELAVFGLEAMGAFFSKGL